MDETRDVIVIGSGAGGLATALVAARLGLDVTLIEKTQWLGGTTALSGGGMWIPNSGSMIAAGYGDSVEEAEAYLKALLGNRYDDKIVSAFLASAPEAIAFLQKHADLKVTPSGMNDYETELPGAVQSRCLLSEEYDGKELGPLMHRIRPALPQISGPLGIPIGSTEVPIFLSAHKSLGSAAKVLRLFARHVIDLLRFGRTSRFVNGNALVARLVKGADAAGVNIRTECEATGLIVENGAVTGVEVLQRGERIALRARNGAVLATGGFGANRAMIEQHLPLPDAMRSLAPEGSTGDGINMASIVGAYLAEGNSAEAIWTPMSAKIEAGQEIQYPHLLMDRLMPGSIMVDVSGRRFANEADHYQGLGTVMNEKGVKACYLIGDATFLKQYGMGFAFAGPWSRKALLRTGYLRTAATIRELAAVLGIDPDTLVQTIGNFNTHAEQGRDPEFHRGESAYSRALGDPSHKPNANLAPIVTPPFYAIEIHPGLLCTMVGLDTDIDARVLNRSGSPIPGLFAVGIDMNSPWKGAYPGAGASLGPVVTFAYRAAHALVRNRVI